MTCFLIFLLDLSSVFLGHLLVFNVYPFSFFDSIFMVLSSVRRNIMLVVYVSLRCVI